MLSRDEYEKIHQLCQESPQALEVQKLLRRENQLQLSMVSHEVRNPVTLINSFLQLMASTHPEVKAFPYWNDVMENMEFLRSLLAQLSEYNNAQKLNRSEVNLYHILRSFTESMASALSSQNITITFRKEGPIPPFLLDSSKIRQVFLNLVRNAAEAMDGRGGTIIITLSADFDTATIRIRDDGPGIPAEYQSSIFDFFVTHKKDGTGLGLAIARSTVEAHGGTIGVSSIEGQGAEFIIRLPIVYE
ncbi:MAG: two-component system sensor histidine kinase NtrB [Ruminococcus sp.]|jgi:two-component system sporulation sensor kinase C